MPAGAGKIPSSDACQRVYNDRVRPFPDLLEFGQCLTGLQSVEVAYDVDMDSFNAWACDRVGYLHRRPGYPAHLPQHADYARGRVVVSRRCEPAHAAGTDGTAGEGEPAHDPGVGFRRRFRSSVE